MSGYATELWGLLAQGGFVMPPLVLGALLLWYALGYRFVMLYLGDRRSVRYLFDAAKDGAIDKPRGVIARAAKTAAELAKSGRPGIEHRVDEELYETEKELGRFSGLADGVVRAAPLLGLLGTVSGMIETFDSLGDMTLVSGTTGGVAGGISEALFSTQLGLVVAVPGLLIGRLMLKQQKRLGDELTKLKDLVRIEEAAA